MKSSYNKKPDKLTKIANDWNLKFSVGDDVIFETHSDVIICAKVGAQAFVDRDLKTVLFRPTGSNEVIPIENVKGKLFLPTPKTLIWPFMNDFAVLKQLGFGECQCGSENPDLYLALFRWFELCRCQVTKNLLSKYEILIKGDGELKEFNLSCDDEKNNTSNKG